MVSKYIRNPLVVLREEEPDGALLFHPDRNEVKVINSTGVIIWMLCDGTRDLKAITDAVRESFDDVPEDQVTDDIQSFITAMMENQFIGIVRDQPGEY